MQSLKEYIREKRPALAKSSLTTYDSILRNLYKRVFPADTSFDVTKFDDADRFIGHLREMPASKRKTYLSALYVISENKAYRQVMMTDIRTYQSEIDKQVKTPSQQANWAEQAEITRIWTELKADAALLYKKKTKTVKDLQVIQSFVLMSCLGGMFIAPRRSLDFCAFKLTNVHPTNDNFMQGKKAFVFNVYKTAKTHGRQVVPIPLALQKIITKWATVNPSEYLFIDTKGQPLTSVKLNQRLNGIFRGKKISVNALRHSYLSWKYGNTIATNEALARDMAAMGSSKNVSANYIKR